MDVGIERVDHVAIEVGDFDERLRRLTEDLGMTLKRIGRYRADPTRRIAMVSDAAGFKLELIEGTAPHGEFRHIAWRVGDVVKAHDALVAAGYESVRAPAPLPPAKGETAVVSDGSGLSLQLVRYDADSPDL
jgi:hypothetical protein